jgi:hypothetical protein
MVLGLHASLERAAAEQEKIAANDKDPEVRARAKKLAEHLHFKAKVLAPYVAEAKKIVPGA